MFDVYLNEKRDRLLVIARGQLIPLIESAGRWRKKKKHSTDARAFIASKILECANQGERTYDGLLQGIPPR